MPAPVPPDAGLGAWRREPGTVVRQAASVPPGMGDSVVILAESEAPGVPTEWAAHTHPMHELVWVRNGTLTARVADRMFTVSEGCGLWLPAGSVHAGRLTANVELYDAFFAPDRTPVAFDRPTAIAMTPVLMSLLVYLARADLDPGARARAEAVVFDVLEPAVRQTVLDLPGDDVVAVVAQALLDDPADGCGLGVWAARLGVSERTLARAFRRSTGLSFVQWRRALRVHHALTLLSEGCDVRSTAEMLGYAQPSTFIVAFRQVMGATPGAFVVTTTADGV